MAQNLGEINHLFIVQAPIDKTSTSWATPYVDLKGALSFSFRVLFGAMTGTSTDDGTTVTLEASSTSVSNASEISMAFNYRLSAAAATDTLGAVTAVAAATGVKVVKTTNDNMALIIAANTADVANAVTTGLGRYVRIVGTATGSNTAAPVAVECEMIPRYAGATMVSAAS